MDKNSPKSRDHSIFFLTQGSGDTTARERRSTASLSHGVREGHFKLSNLAGGCC